MKLTLVTLIEIDGKLTCPGCGESIEINHNSVTQCVGCKTYLLNQGNMLFYTQDETELPPNDMSIEERTEYDKRVLQPLEKVLYKALRESLMTKWEYFGYRFFNADEPNTFLYRMQTINKLGENSWELVSIDSGIAYFKRIANKKSLIAIEENIPYKQAYDD